MSDDLISRSWILEQYGLKDCTKYGNETAEQQRKSYETMMMYEIAGMIEDAPAAYDAGKVVERLEDLKRRYWFTIANTGDEKLDCAYENVGNALDKAVEIVKSGGVADD